MTPLHPQDSANPLNFRPIAEINVTPLVDVVLILLTVFMVTAPLLSVGIPVDLPRAGAIQSAAATKPLIVTLNRSGDVSVAQTRVDRASLPSVLADLHASNAARTVYVRADRGLPYGDVVELVAQVQATGFERVSLLARPRVGPADAP